MKKNLLILTLVTIAIPSFAFASWWNPTTWFSNWSFSSNSDTKTQVLEKRIAELESKLNTNSTTTPAIVATTTATTTPIVKKISPVIDNSALIERQVKAQVEATLKAKADQDALVAKQKADAQALIDAQNANNLAAKQAADKAAQDAANLAAQQLAQQLAAQQQATQAAAQAKHDQLNAINQQIAALNAKYAQDMQQNNSGTSVDFANAVHKRITDQYINDYNVLMAQFQQIQYSN